MDNKNKKDYIKSNYDSDKELIKRENYNDDNNFVSYNEYIESKQRNLDSSQKDKGKKRFNIEKIIGNKFHISFEARVIASILFILLLIVWACILFLNAFNFGHNMKIDYSEDSNINYKVCVNSVDYYPNTCLNEEMEYVTAITNKIKTDFKYNATYSNFYNEDLSYHIVALTKIYDKNNNKKVLFENEDLLVKKTKLEIKNKKISLKKTVDVDFKKYNNYVLGYQNNYSLGSSSTLEVVMYLNDKNETRKVASAIFPLGSKTFGITKNTISNLDKEIIINNNKWNSYNIIFAIVGSLLIVVALLILFRLTKLVLKVSSKRDEFQTKLAYILREYDRLIVIARNGFVTTTPKNVTEVDSFDELLDARNVVNRPIIYSRINDVKVEFIVEDDFRIYKYIMKESDFNNYE